MAMARCMPQESRSNRGLGLVCQTLNSSDDLESLTSGFTMSVTQNAAWRLGGLFPQDTSYDNITLLILTLVHRRYYPRAFISRMRYCFLYHSNTLQLLISSTVERYKISAQKHANLEFHLRGAH